MVNREDPIYFALEAGGTKCTALIAHGAHDILAEANFATRDPANTLPAIQEFFRREGRDLRPSACGIASFGPIHLDPQSPSYGRIGKTPKPGWAGTSMRAIFEGHDCPIGVDSDVNGAALAEYLWGAGRGLTHLAYATIGTGIGVGVLRDDICSQGAWHYEIGHWRPARHKDDVFPGNCAFHKDCLEGLAAGPAISARWGASLSELDPEHPAHAVQAHYLAELCASLTFGFAPQRIILGGGVMNCPGLLERVQSQSAEKIAGYAQWPEAQTMSTFIVAPGLGPRAGVLGAIAVAQSAHGRYRAEQGL